MFQCKLFYYIWKNKNEHLFIYLSGRTDSPDRTEFDFDPNSDT